MIERASEFGASQAAPLAVGDTSQKTAGAMLREAREAHNLHIDVVAAALKVPSQKLQALEDDRIDALPDPVFARALAASVCRALKVDPAPVLAKLPGSPRAGLADADRTLASGIRPGAPRSGRSDAGWRPSGLLTLVVVALLLGAAALFWLPQSAFDRASAALTRTTTPATGLADAAPADGPASASTAATPGLAVDTVTPAAAPVVAAAGAPTASVAPATPPASAPAASGDTLTFVAKSDSWITVTQAGGKAILRRTVQAGETVGISGTLPLTVVIGRASGIEVQLRGQPYDLAPVTRNGGTARFEVKS